MKITFVEDELKNVIHALDLYSRIWMGQYDHLLWDMRWNMNCSELDAKEHELIEKLMKIRSILLPESTHWGFSGSYGIFNPNLEPKALQAYDMQQVLRYELSYHKHPEGGYTVNFKKPMFLGQNDPYPPIKAECRDDAKTSKILIDVELVPEQLSIIHDALCVLSAEDDVDVQTIFSYYTTEEQRESVWTVIEEIQTILDSIEKEERRYSDMSGMIRNINKEIRK